MAVGQDWIDKHRVKVEEAMTEAFHVAVIFLGAEEAMVENVGGVGIRAKHALELVFLLAVDDAVVHLHVEWIIERLVVAVEGVVCHQTAFSLLLCSLAFQ